MTEAQFLEGYDPSAYARPSVAVDVVLLGIAAGRPAALLLPRLEHPFAQSWTLPGGFVGLDEPLDAAAMRVLDEKAGIRNVHCEQLYTFGSLGRDPRMRVISVAWLAVLNEPTFDAALQANPALRSATLRNTGGMLEALGPQGEALSLGFDHGEILALALQRLRGKLDYSELAFALLPERFTLRQLQDVHEAILGTRLNKPAFRRRMLDRGWLVPTGEREAGTSFRPAELYCVRAAKAEPRVSS